MKRLVRERKNKDMNQTDLAFELRIHPSQLSKIENGRMIPFKPTAKKLEEFFNMEINELLQDLE